VKIALIGSSGLLGSALKKALYAADIQALCLTHCDFDLLDPDDFKIFLDFNPDIVINTAAYLGVEPCEVYYSEAFALNVKAVENLANFCQKNAICLVYISTDGVFDGYRGGYHEKSTPNPLNLYGLTKYGGELMTQNLCEQHYIFRIPILFGTRENKGNIFIEKMFALYTSGKKELKIADDVINKPSYADDIAQQMVKILISALPHGIYHLFNGGEDASLYDFACEFFAQKRVNDICIMRAKASDFADSEQGKKPLNTTLTSIKVEALRDWRIAMKDYCNKEVYER